jgi:hypothetical protein
MAQEEFEIEISPDGKVTVRTIGFKGESCMDYADLFVQILGGKEESREKTAEYFESEAEVKRRIDVRQRR